MDGSRGVQAFGDESLAERDKRRNLLDFLRLVADSARLTGPFFALFRTLPGRLRQLETSATAASGNTNAQTAAMPILWNVFMQYPPLYMGSFDRTRAPKPRVMHTGVR